MPTIHVHAGDFGVNQDAVVVANAIVFRKPGFLSPKEKVPLSLLDEVAIASAESVKRLGGTLGWGAAGALLLGPLGMLAGVLVGGRSQTVTFVAHFRDGRRLLGTTDAKTFTQLSAEVFQRGPRQAVEPVAHATPAMSDPPAVMLRRAEAAQIASPARARRRLPLRVLAIGIVLVFAGMGWLQPKGSPQSDTRAGAPVPQLLSSPATAPMSPVVLPTMVAPVEPLPAPASMGKFNPNAMQEPGEICAAAGIGVPASHLWRASTSTAGGYVCDNLGAASQFGPAGPLGMPTNISFFVYGSGARKLDQATLKLNTNNPVTADEGKRRLIEASCALAAKMNILLPGNFADIIRKQRTTMLRVPPSEPDRILLSWACPQLSQMVAAARWIAPRKFRAVLS